MSANLGSASGSIHLEVAQARQNVKALAGDLRNFTGQVGSGFGGASAFIDQHEQSIRTVGLGLTGLGTILSGLFGAGVWNAANVEEAFSIMQAGTGATGAELDKLQQKALQLGKDTSFSATEAALAITELGKAGMPVETILNGAADAVVNLAVAGEMDLTTAANHLTAAMNQYGLSADQAVMVTDTLARGAAVSTADIGDLAAGLGFVGTTANQLGISLPHTTAALAALNDQGVRGSRAGTSLNQMLTSIINPSQKASRVMDQLGLSMGGTFELIDSQTGQMKSLPEIISNVHEATKDLTESERQRYINQIFGEQGGRAMNALLQTQTEEAREAGKAWEDYEEGVESGTTAAENASAKMDNLKGDLEQLKGGLETLSYTAMKAFLPAFRAVVQALDGVLSAIIGLPPGLQAVIAGLIGLVGVLSLGAGGFLLMLPRINDTIKAYKALRVAFQATSLGSKGLSGSLRGLSVALRGLIAAHPVLFAVMAVAAALMLAYKTNFLGFGDAVRKVAGFIRDFVTNVVEGFRTFRQNTDALTAGLVAIGYALNLAGFTDFGAKVSAFAGKIRELIELFQFMEGMAKLGGLPGMAARYRALGAVIEHLTGLPVVEMFTAIGAGIDRTVAAVRKIIAGFREMAGALLDGNWSKALKKFQKFIAGLGDLLGAPAKFIGQFLKSIKTGFKPLDKVLSNLGKVWVDFGRLIQEVFQGDIKGALEVGKRLLRHFADYLLSLGPLIWEGAKAIGRLLVDAFQAIDWGAVGRFLLDGLKSAIVELREVGSAIGDAASGLWDWITDSIGDIDWGGVRDTLRSALERAISGLSAALDWVLETGVPAIAGWIVDIAGDVWGGLKALAGWGAGAVSGVIDLALSVLDTLAETVLSGFASAKDWLIDKLPWLEGPLGAAGELLSGAFDLTMNVAGKVASTLSDAWSSAKSLISSVFSWLGDFFGISDAGEAGEVAAKAASAGFDLAFNLAGQFLSTLSDAWSSVTSLIGSAASWITGFFGISDAGEAAEAATKAASGGFDLSFSLAGSILSTLSDAWSSVGSLISSVASWVTGFFGIGDAGEVAASAIKSASSGFSLSFRLMGSLISYLSDAWSSITGLIGSVVSWLADFFGITDAGEVGETVVKSAAAIFSFTTKILGSVASYLGEGWSSVGDLVNKAAHWISDFFGIKSASDLGQTVEKTATAALTLAAEFKDDITDNLDSAWDSVTSLVGSVGGVAKDLVDDAWGGTKKVVESTVDLVVTVTGSVANAIDGGLDWLFGGGGSEGSPAVSLETRLNEVATAIETGIARIAEAFAGFDATGAVTELNAKLVGALDGMSGDSIGSAAKAWVARGLAKIGEGITSDSLMTIPRSLDTALLGAFAGMSGDSISGAIKGWMTRAVGLAVAEMTGHGLALARGFDTAAGAGFGTLSGESLSGGIKGWLARGVTLVVTGLTVLGTSLAIALDTAVGAGLGTLSGESLSTGILAWVVRAVALTASLLVPLGTALAVATDTAANAGFGTLSGESLSGALVAWLDRAQAFASAAIDMTTLATGTATKLQSAIGPELTRITTGFRTFATNVTTEMRKLQTNATREMTTAATNLRQRANTARTDVQSAFRGIESAARTMASNVSREASRAGSDLASQLRNGANQARTAMSTAMNEIVGIVQNAAGRMRSAGYSVGAAAGDGVAAGLNASLGGVRSAANALIDEVDRAMRAKAQIASPSKLTTWIGQMLGEGPAVGMLSRLRDIRRAAEAVIDAAIPAFNPAALDPGFGRYIEDQLARQRWMTAGLGASGPGAGPTIGTQQIEINVTQAPGEDGEQFASRVVSLLVDAYNGVNGLGV